jgi:hypothetical protein
MKESTSLHTLAWILIITGTLAWLSLFLVGLLSSLVLGFLGIVAIVIFTIFVLTVFDEPKQDKESEFFSKNITL